MAGINYDKNSNIKTLERYGLTGISGNNKTYGAIDRLTYHYTANNQLKAVNDAIASTGIAYDFRDGQNNDVKGTGGEYEYDYNGNMTRDRNKGIVVRYNHLDLPEAIDLGRWASNCLYL